MHQVNFQWKKISSAAFEALVRTLEGMSKEFVRTVNISSTAGGVANRNNNAVSANGSNGASAVKIGLTFSGLLHFHYLFLKKNRRLSHRWTIVNLFGYQLA